MTLNVRQKTVLLAIGSALVGGLLAKFVVIPIFFR